MFHKNKTGKYVFVWFVFAFVLSACGPRTVSANPSAPIAVTETPALVQPVVAQSEECRVIYTITICIDRVDRSSLNTNVKLKILGLTDQAGFNIISDDDHGLSVTLTDEKGRVYAWVGQDPIPSPDNQDKAYYYQLSFQPVPDDVKKLTLSLPIIAVPSEMKTDRFGFQLDLGENLQPGETKDLDTTAVIDGHTFHFVRAEFEGDGASSLRVTFYTDPLNLPDEIFAIVPMFRDREKPVSFGSKYGMNGSAFRMFGDLVIPPGKSSGVTENTYIKGVLNLGVYQMTYAYRGPFELQFTLP